MDEDVILSSPDIISEEMVCIPQSDADWLGEILVDVIQTSEQGGFYQFNAETIKRMLAILDYL